MIDFTPQQLLLRLCAFVVIALTHAMTVAAAAVALGDPGPRHDGRLGPHPSAHLDIVGLVCGVLFSVGWIKPIAIDPAQLRPGRIGLVLIVLAAATATLLVALVLLAARPWLLPLLSDSGSELAFALIEVTAQLAVWFALVNLLPIPPLTGAHLVAAVVPRGPDLLARLRIAGTVLLAIIAATGMLTTVLAPLHLLLAGWMLGR